MLPWQAHGGEFANLIVQPCSTMMVHLWLLINLRGDKTYGSTGERGVITCYCCNAQFCGRVSLQECATVGTFCINDDTMF